MNIPDMVAALISEDADEVKRYFAAVAVVRWRDQWLLGLSKSKDDRYFKWCCPGGGIEPGESPEVAAVRECFEETNAKCKSIGKAFETSRVGVAFVPCIITGSQPKLKSKADEFVALGFFKEKELHNLRLYENVLELIKIAKRYK